VHLACVEGDVPLAFTVQPISRNDKLFIEQLLGDSWKTGVRFRVVAGDRQYRFGRVAQWTKGAFQAETAIPTIKGKEDKKGGRGIRVDSKFRVTGPKRFFKAYRGRLCAERVFKKLKRQLNLENHHYRGLANVTIHACITLMCVLAVIIASYKTGKPKKARSIRYWTT
jgi:transposase